MTQVDVSAYTYNANNEDWNVSAIITTGDCNQEEEWNPSQLRSNEFSEPQETKEGDHDQQANVKQVDAEQSDDTMMMDDHSPEEDMMIEEEANIYPLAAEGSPLLHNFVISPLFSLLTPSQSLCSRVTAPSSTIACHVMRNYPFQRKRQFEPTICTKNVSSYDK